MPLTSSWRQKARRRQDETEYPGEGCWQKKLTESERSSLLPRWQLAGFMRDEIGEVIGPLSLYEHHHFAFHGTTGKGKTFAIEQMIVGLLRDCPATRIIFFDPKGGDLAPYLVELIEVADPRADPEAAMAKLEEIEAEVTTRERLMRAAGLGGTFANYYLYGGPGWRDHPRLVLIFDEVATSVLAEVRTPHKGAILTADEEWRMAAQSFIVAGLNTFRSSLCSLGLLFQSSRQSQFRGDLLEAFSANCRLRWYAGDSKAMAQALGYPEVFEHPYMSRRGHFLNVYRNLTRICRIIAQKPLTPREVEAAKRARSRRHPPGA